MPKTPRLFQISFFFLLHLVCIPSLLADNLATIDTEAMSGEPDRIRLAISQYLDLDTTDPEIQWRLIRAYYNYYDELAETNQRKQRRWAAEAGYELAKTALKQRPDHAQTVYFSAVIGLCYLDFHRIKAIFLIDDVLDTFKKARQLDPTIDDAGPDRNLGLLYHELPGWPIGPGDRKKALKHLKQAYKIAPQRAANRLPLAKALIEQGQFDEALPHISFVRAGNFKVSSAHWRAIYLRRVEEVADELRQAQSSAKHENGE